MFMKYGITRSNNELPYTRYNQRSENSVELISCVTMMVKALIAVVAMANVILMADLAEIAGK